MNLKNNPTAAQLQPLIAACEDSKGHHMLWIDNEWDVHIQRFDQNLTKADWLKTMEGKYRELADETWRQGNGYVGPAAAADPKHVQEVFDMLIDFRDGKTPTLGIG